MWSLLLASSLCLAAGKATSSSFATDAEGKHPADAAFDGLLGVGWGEGVPGDGEGSWLDLDLGAATPIQVVSLWPGNLRDGQRSFKQYGRPKLIRILVDGKPQGEPLRLQDEMTRVDIPLTVSGRVVRIEIVEAFGGIVYSDTYIAELAVNFTEGERGKTVEKVDAWRASPEGQKLQLAFEEQVVAAFTAHKANPDDLESMEFLMSAAGDGPDYLRKKVGSLVPIGYRVAAIVPDQKAMDAIRKLKDPNGISGLEMASLRAIGKQQREITEVIEMFYAYAEMMSGGRRNIPAWGTTGWEPGALQGFGEPLAIEVDRYGETYVADTANHRLQRYSPEGVSNRQWGAKADISNRWFARTRKWYAAGSASSEEQGGFVDPVDVELIPGKEGEGFATLDALGRVQVFDEAGNPLIGWTVRVDEQLQPKVGGEGYLGWVEGKKQLVVVMGDEAITYTLDSEEVARWKVKDGTPNALQVLPDGKIYMVFGDKIVDYNPDGFRYGEVGSSADLGEGYEDLDITADEKGALWAFTDTGWVFAFKKPGKVDWSLRITEVPLQHPRFAVSQGLVFYTDRDQVHKVDALQAHIDSLDTAENAARKAAIDNGEPPPEPKKKGKN